MQTVAAGVGQERARSGPTEPQTANSLKQAQIINEPDQKRSNALEIPQRLIIVNGKKATGISVKIL